MPKIARASKTGKKPVLRVIGLMSGTSMDGIDLALIETDGESLVRRKAFLCAPYAPSFRRKLRGALGKRKAPGLARELTLLHARAVKMFLRKLRVPPPKIDALGFHGHTILHAPEKRITVQVGDGGMLAKETGIPVVWDFRGDDVKAGGQGAPLTPAYHRALAAKWKQPCAFVNIGGVSNITYIEGRRLIAFDSGPGNALLDDWMLRKTGRLFDEEGRLARKGKADPAWLKRFLSHPYFRRKPPKSLDRDAFAVFLPHHLDAANGAATLAAMTAEAIAAGLSRLPKKPRLLAVTGGGRRNDELMRLLRKVCACKVVAVEARGLNGDALEAEAFAYLAARALKGLPIAFTETTGRRRRNPA